MGRLQTDQSGLSVVEVLLASSILLMLAVAVSGALLYSQESAVLSGNRSRANMLAEEGLEAVRNLRDNSWSNLTDGTYGLVLSGNQWTLSGSQDILGLFTRRVTIATVDANRKDITAEVTWQQNPQRSGTVSLRSRLTNWLRAAAASWANPARVGGFNNAGNQDGLKLQTDGNYVYAVLAAATPDFVILDVTNPAAPTLVGSLTLSGAPTNIAVAGNFAYVTSDTNTQELQIINISNPAAPTLVGGYNAPGNADARGVYAVGSTVYMVRMSSTDNEFFIINAANPASPSLVGSLNLNGQGNEVSVLGTSAFVASALDTQELQVINIANPAAPVIAGSLNLAGTADALTITSYASTVILGTAAGVLNVVNVTTPTTPTVTGTYATTASINDVALNGTNTNVFAATSAPAAEFQVVSISTPSAPTLLGSLNLGVGINGVAYNAVQDRAYVANTNNTEEVTSIAPQ